MIPKIIWPILIVMVLSWSCSKDDDLPVEENVENEDQSIENIEPWTGLQIVMFTPSDVELPNDYNERMKEVVDYAEWFFDKWMDHWGYSVDKPLKIQRDDDGNPILLRIKGDHTQASGAYSELGYASSEVIPKALKKYKMPQANQTWWIISYPGPGSSAFRGGGSFRGGTSSANYTPNTGALLEPGDDNLAIGAAETFKLKAVIHELTHALGIEHIGPLDGDGFGNSLMGSTNKSYKKIHPDDNRVYLTKASAAMLWKHPLFSGNYEDITTTPSVEMTDFQSTYNQENNTLMISGRLHSDHTAHTVIISNDSDTDISEYWRKTFTGEIAEDGTFTCEIKELNNASGNLNIAFCFNNGAVSGKNGKFGVVRGISKPYVYQNNTYEF